MGDYYKMSAEGLPDPVLYCWQARFIVGLRGFIDVDMLDTHTCHKPVMTLEIFSPPGSSVYMLCWASGPPVPPSGMIMCVLRG
jgi:hypothetical protein